MRDKMAAAIEAVRAAARVTRAVQAELVTADTLSKKDKSPVTVADFASQAVVGAMLGEAFPEVPMVGEEDAAELREGGNEGLRARVVEQVRSAYRAGAGEDEVLRWIDRGGHDPLASNAERYWTLDPIDGTKGFLRREQYAIALALIEKGEVVLAVLGCPNLHGGLVLAAERGAGAREVAEDGSEKRVTVSGVAKPQAASLCESVESGHSDQGQSAEIARRLGITREPVRMDSQAKYAGVARGDAEIYLRLPTRADYREKIWDHAAGMLCVVEAGGRVTDAEGKPLDFSRGRTLTENRGIIATNGPIHDAVVDAVRVSLAGA